LLRLRTIFSNYTFILTFPSFIAQRRLYFPWYITFLKSKLYGFFFPVGFQVAESLTLSPFGIETGSEDWDLAVWLMMPPLRDVRCQVAAKEWLTSLAFFRFTSSLWLMVLWIVWHSFRRCGCGFLYLPTHLIFRLS